eukprot:NODE_492_length_6837_cov_0.395963.p5 type:complete len:183 gc:universal NODE_492_length_6837_cov_0.395963:6680-6132(-)
MKVEKFHVGDQFPKNELKTVKNDEIDLFKSNEIIHLVLRRFSGCPICNVYLKLLSSRIPDIKNAGIRSLFVFHSTADVILENQGTAEWASELEFIADPDKLLYKELGAFTASKTAFLHPKILKVVKEGLSLVKSYKRNGDEAGKNQLPMEIMIKNGKIIAIHYGLDPYDQWSVDQILENGKQ